MTSPIQVTQEDRDAAQDFFASWPRVSIPDYLPAALAEAFAHHRLSAKHRAYRRAAYYAERGEKVPKERMRRHAA